MRFLIINSDYPEFLTALYSGTPSLSAAGYDVQLQARNESLFGVADFYPRNLRSLGHEAVEVHMNNDPMQRAWALETGHADLRRPPLLLRMRRGIVPWLSRDIYEWRLRVLRAQISAFAPDVVINHAIDEIPPAFWEADRKRIPLLIGQLAAPIAHESHLTSYDLLLSSLPNFIDGFRAAGLRAELFRLGFDASVLRRFRSRERDIAVSFVGSLSSAHAARIAWLEEICCRADVQVWAPTVDHLPARSAIRAAYIGSSWGASMYEVLARSRITLNHHIGIAGRCANNMRLYEATGLGALLITDQKEDLHEMFTPGDEVVTYGSAVDCATAIQHYLHDDEPRRCEIAAAGQCRTLSEHTYLARMEQLVDIVDRALSPNGHARAAAV